MSVPRRISLRREGDQLRLIQQLEIAAIAGVAQAGLDQQDISIASHLQLSGDTFLLHLGDCNGGRLMIERADCILRVTRLDPVNPFLDAMYELPIRTEHRLELWLDAGSIEIIGDRGAVSLTMQHRMAGERLTLDWNGGLANQECAA
jgi:hypothetical protein